MLEASWFVPALFVGIICQVVSLPDKSGPPGPLGPAIIAGMVSKDDIDKCLAEVGMTKEEFETHLKHHGESEPNEKDLCLIRCTVKKAGAIDQDGTLNIDLIKTHLPPLGDDEAVTIACMEELEAIKTCQDIKKVMKCLPKLPKRNN
nr:odorant binding protein 8 [Pagiophloeus tsushimanus]